MVFLFQETVEAVIFKEQLSDEKRCACFLLFFQVSNIAVKAFCFEMFFGIACACDFQIGMLL